MKVHLQICKIMYELRQYLEMYNFRHKKLPIKLKEKQKKSTPILELTTSNH